MREGQAGVLTESELKRALAVAKDDRYGLRNVAILSMSHGLGLRAKELASLKVEDVLDLNGNLRECVKLLRGFTKGGKHREVFLTNPKLCRALQDYIKARQESEGVAFNRQAPLFKGQRGAFSPNTMQMAIKAMYRRAGIEHASSHSGRRGFATRLISNGIDIRSVQELMGHSSIQMTARYAATNPDTLKRVAARAL